MCTGTRCQHHTTFHTSTDLDNDLAVLTTCFRCRIFACVSLGRLLPVEPYLILSPFTSATGHLIPFPGRINTDPFLRESLAWINAIMKVGVALVFDRTGPNAIARRLRPLKGIVVKIGGGCPWPPSLQLAVVSLFQKVGGAVTSKGRKANYLVGSLDALDSVYVCLLGIS